jgi:glutamyl-tRNA synthetase
MKQTRVRFAPSPTGYLHLGGVRTALYNYLFARQTGGVFILRIEDTDRARLVEDSVESMIASLRDLGIDYDEGPYKSGRDESYFQSERLELYHKHVDILLEAGKAYRCFCSKETLDEMRKSQESRKETTKYDGRCISLSDTEIEEKINNSESYVIRIKIPTGEKFVIEDLIRGEVEILSDLVEDQVILKADGFPTYHLASVIDDHFMDITHVLRGEEWLYSTPKHLFLYDAFGWKPPIWVHLPLLLNTDRSKLSKRHGDFSVSKYLRDGYLPEAILNFVVLLGWHAADDREIYSLSELETEFSIDRINKSGAIFDITKLDWLNGWYIRNMDIGYIAGLCREYFISAGIDISDETKYLKVINRARDQISKLPEIVSHGSVFYRDINISPENREVISTESAQIVITHFINKLMNFIDKPVSKDDISDICKQISAETGIKGKNLFFPLRIALFGDTQGPDIPLLIDIYGIEDSIEKITAVKC